MKKTRKKVQDSWMFWRRISRGFVWQRKIQEIEWDKVVLLSQPKTKLKQFSQSILVIHTFLSVFNKLNFKVSKENPLKSPKDLVLLNLAADLYEYSLNKEAILSYVIQNVTKLPVVNNQTVKINVQTEG